jgi:lipopolysaccharide transport system ATP-binding protein
MNSLTVDGIGKCYHIPVATKGRDSSGPRRLLGALRNTVTGRARPRLLPKTKEFWALRNASFSVESGTVLGIIGANGAGKSTLLKVLARVTTPTEGRVMGVGRVVSLLELGAGFNPEVAAHENIFMNAAMYGIPRTEVHQHLDEIIAFAEIEDYVNTPLKFYSSGMYLRLAFSVAINMKPNILLADEILAVGDISFKERCLNRVSELARDGLSVLFVSHDMEAITRVCNRVMWIHGGKISQQGDPETVVTEYQNAAWARADAAQSERGRHRNKFAELIGARLVSTTGKDIGAAPTSEEVFIRIRFRVTRAPIAIRVGFDLYRRRLLLFRSIDQLTHTIETPQVYDGWGTIPANFLSEISYSVHVFLLLEDGSHSSSLIIYNAVTFMGYATGKGPTDPAVLKGGLLAPRLDWRVDAVEENAVVSDA